MSGRHSCATNAAVTASCGTRPWASPYELWRAAVAVVEQYDVVDRAQVLGRVSAAQLAVGVGGMAVAVRRRHPYDVPMLHGKAETVGRDTMLMGTALSAPMYMLVAQGVAVRRCLRDGNKRAARTLGALGAAMVAGYLGESLVRRRLKPSGYDRLESPLVVLGLGLSGVMAALGLPRQPS